MELKRLACTMLCSAYQALGMNDLRRLDYITTRNGDTVTAVFSGRPDIVIDVTLYDGAAMLQVVADRMSEAMELDE